ncbi:hypothetical protein [Rhizobium ruizarguesonis]|uniref:hypothetical protein n=1 Tax=Rhizobium ruizarguesonis TaxID=2081791 RepID=UPI001FE02B7F|nr:hypothetical protein [Rhizobium ruizarguesonis]
MEVDLKAPTVLHPSIWYKTVRAGTLCTYSPAGVALSGRILYIANMSDEQTISNSTKSAVEKVLRDRLGQAGFSGADIRADRDSDGDPILLVDVKYAYSDKPINSKLTYGLSTEVRKALSALGETRFPHIRHHFDEQQKIAS